MNIAKKIIEDEAFWQNHARLQKSSGYIASGQNH